MHCIQGLPRAAVPTFKRRLEGLADFAAAIAPSTSTWPAFDAACHRLLLQLPLQHGMPLQSVLTLLSQREVTSPPAPSPTFRNTEIGHGGLKSLRACRILQVKGLIGHGLSMLA